jgi:hypothetical protein
MKAAGAIPPPSSWRYPAQIFRHFPAMPVVRVARYSDDADAPLAIFLLAEHDRSTFDPTPDAKFLGLRLTPPNLVL